MNSTSGGYYKLKGDLNELWLYIDTSLSKQVVVVVTPIKALEENFFLIYLLIRTAATFAAIDSAVV